MTTYASFDIHPSPRSYLTPGKRYEVYDQGSKDFCIRDDRGCRIYCLWVKCAHLDGGNWTLHDSPADPMRDAAPDMHEALRELEYTLAGEAELVRRRLADVRAKARAALAKAEGKA